MATILIKGQTLKAYSKKITCFRKFDLRKQIFESDQTGVALKNYSTSICINLKTKKENLKTSYFDTGSEKKQ